jgi:hypothetical protein
MSALLVVIFVAVGEANHPTTRVAATAARELLGPEHEVQVREIDRIPDDARAAAIGSTLHAGAIVELAWQQPTHQQVQIRFSSEPLSGFNDEFIRFADADDLAERGRTVGYAIASSVTASRGSTRRADAPSPRAATAEPPRSIIGQPPSPPPRQAHSNHGAIDAAASAATGIGGPAGGWGGSLSGTWYVARPFGLRLGGSARSGQMSEVQSTSLLFHAAAGVVWRPIAANTEHPFDLGARLDGLLLREQLTHFDSDDPEPATAMRWLPGVGLALEGAWFFSASAGLLASFGTEVAFGQTDVTLHRQIVTTIPPLRLVFQAGVRAVF